VPRVLQGVLNEERSERRSSYNQISYPAVQHACQINIYLPLRDVLLNVSAEIARCSSTVLATGSSDENGGGITSYQNCSLSVGLLDVARIC
jgi:hypothetical protein